MRIAPLLLALASAVPVCAQGSATSDVIVVRPGRLQRLAVTAPGAAVAGQSFDIVLEALDAQGNRIVDSAGIEGEFRVETAGRAVATPERLTASDFSGGMARVSVRDERAESIALLFTSGSGAVLGQTRDIRILAAELDRFVVRAPSSVAAGLPARVDLEAQDRFGNRVGDLGASRELLITGDGTGLFEPGSLAAAAFTDGRASFSVVYRVAEAVRLTISASGGKRGSSEPIQVKPAPPHHFEIAAPRSVVAGRAFALGLKAYDAFNNPVSEYARIGGDVALARSGEGSIEPRAVEVGRFQDGAVSMPVTVFAAGTFRIRVTALGGAIANESETIRAEPGEAARFEIENAASATVKEPVAVKLVAYDAWGNAGASLPSAVRLADERGLLAAITIAPTGFERGVAHATVVPEKVGRTTLVASLEGGRALSSGAALEVGPGEPARFEVEVPPTVIAGEPFEVTLTAFDSWGNLVTDFDVRGRAVSVGSKSDGPVLLPYRVLASQFEQGRAHIQPMVEKAGRLRLHVASEGGRIETLSAEIAVRTSRPDHFLVDIPASAVAGSPFEVTLESRDRFGNRVIDYEKVGQDVRLEVEGQGKLDPPIVPARSFRDGFARVSVSYDRAERLVIRPRFASGVTEGRGDGPVEVAPGFRDGRDGSRDLQPEGTQLPQRRPASPRGSAAPAVDAGQPVAAPCPAAIIHESSLPPATPAAAAAERPTRAGTEAPVSAAATVSTPQPQRPAPARSADPVLAPPPLPAATRPLPTATRPAPRSTPVTIPAPPAAARPTRTPELRPSPTPTPAPTRVARVEPPTPAPAAVTPKLPARTPARIASPPAAVRPARRGEPVTVRDIRFEEGPAKATLRVESLGEIEARVAPEFRYGTEWITISLSPVANDLAPLLGQIQSKTFGATEVKLDGRTAVIALELLAERIDYHVANGPDGVTVTFARPNGSR